MRRLVPLAVQPGLIKDDTPFKVGQAGVHRSKQHAPTRGVVWRLLAAGDCSSARKSTVKHERCLRLTTIQTEKTIAIGTHSHLYVFRENQIFDITPADYTGGNENFTGTSGFGTGRFGKGTFGTARETLNTAQLLTTWSLAVHGEWLIASPRGGKIYVWKNDTSQRATILENAPVQNLGVRVSPPKTDYFPMVVTKKPRDSLIRAVLDTLTLKHLPHGIRRLRIRLANTFLEDAGKNTLCRRFRR